ASRYTHIYWRLWPPTLLSSAFRPTLTRRWSPPSRCWSPSWAGSPAAATQPTPDAGYAWSEGPARAPPGPPCSRYGSAVTWPSPCRTTVLPTCAPPVCPTGTRSCRPSGAGGGWNWWNCPGEGKKIVHCLHFSLKPSSQDQEPPHVDAGPENRSRPDPEARASARSRLRGDPRPHHHSGTVPGPAPGRDRTRRAV